MNTILRVDDFPGTKPQEFWKHNLDNFKRFDDVLARHAIPQYTLGVIPKYTSEKDRDWLASNPRVEVALHGVEHDERFPNEFREWETEDSIFDKIVAATAPLKRCNSYGEVARYIPPHNVIDLKTVRALKRAGFTGLMCGPGSDEQVMQEASKVLHVMYSRHPIFYGRTDEMLDRDGCVERIIHESKFLKERCVTLHWTWEYNIGLNSLDRFLTELGHIFR